MIIITVAWNWIAQAHVYVWALGRTDHVEEFNVARKNVTVQNWLLVILPTKCVNVSFFTDQFIKSIKSLG